MSDEETTPLAKVLDLTTRMLTDIRGDLSGLKADITKVQTDVTKVQADVTSLRVEMDRRFEQVDQRFEQVDQRLDEERARSRALVDVFALAMSGMRVDIMGIGDRLERLELAGRKPT